MKTPQAPELIISTNNNSVSYTSEREREGEERLPVTKRRQEIQRKTEETGS